MSKCALILPSGEASIVAGSLHLPDRGIGVGVVEVHAEELPDVGVPAVLSFAKKSGARDTFAGTVRKLALDPGRKRLSCTVVLGAGRLAAELGPRDHHAGTTELPAGLLARSIVDDAGEQLADGVEAALDKLLVPHWKRARGSGLAALDLLVEVLGLGWRVLPNGRVWVGVETWPEVSSREIGYMLEDGGVRLAPDGAEILPGMTLGGRQLVSVDYMIGTSLRADARAAVAGDPSRRADRTAYGQSYAATVVSQAADGSLELVPDDPILGDDAHPLRGVPLRCGVPGVKIVYQAPAGERVRVAFESRDPRRIFAVPAHDQSAAGADVRGVARVGDAVVVGELAGVANLTTGIVTLTFTPANPVGAPTTGESVTLGGLVQTGSPEVQIRWP